MKINWPNLWFPPINLRSLPRMITFEETNNTGHDDMIYGHVPPFQGLEDAFDVEMLSLQQEKERKRQAEFRAKCDAVHDAVTNSHDPVNRPSHYTFGNIECIDYIKDVLTKEEYIGYLRGCMIKYQHRLRGKGDSAENAGKMNWYNDRLIKELKNNEQV